IENRHLNQKRLLQADGTGFDAYKVDDEERSFIMNFKIDHWLNKGLLPKEVSVKLKIGKAGEAHKNFKYLQQYANKWDEVGQPAHVSLSYHQKKLEDIKYWVKNEFTPQGALNQLGLIGLHGKELRSHKNYPYYIKYMDMVRAKPLAG
ncbi:hypothetical protein JG688_00018207, partial [Phytophthora aleatoria]